MNVQKNLDVVLGEHIEGPLNFFGGTISASDVRSILVQSPVTDGQTYNLDTALLKANNVVLGQPVVPVRTQNLVSLNWSESLAHSPLVTTNTL